MPEPRIAHQPEVLGVPVGDQSRPHVEDEAVLLPAEHPSADPITRFENPDRPPLLLQPEAGRQPGQPAADDHDARHVAPTRPYSPRARTSDHHTSGIWSGRRAHARAGLPSTPEAPG